MNRESPPPAPPATPEPSVEQATVAVLAELEKAAEAMRRAQESLRAP